MKRNSICACAVLVCSLVFQSCQKEDISQNTHSVQQDDSEGKIILGKKLENPYSLENMKKAYESLQSNEQLKSISIDEQVIEPTHYYVRFLPEDSLQLHELVSDSLELFDYPLDYEIEQEGFYYHDSSIPEDKITWQYTAVPVHYEFPNVKYEIIEPCFIPDDSLETELKSTTGIDFLAMLEYESYRLTDNLDEEYVQDNELKSIQRWRLPSKKEPRGTFRVDNTTTGLEGVKRVKIRAHRYVKIKSTYTNESGDYHIDMGFRYNVHYSLIFENATGFKIWGNWAFTAPAHFNMGWHSKSGYNREIYRSSNAWKWATVNNAVHKYYNYCEDYSIAKPPSNLRVWVFENNSNFILGSAAMLRRTWGLKGLTTTSKIANFYFKTHGLNLYINQIALLTKFAQPDITISLNSSITQTDNVYNVTFHECAHASHWTKVKSSYWIKYINYIITYGAYGDGTGRNAGYCGVGEMWANYIGALFERKAFIRYWPYNSTAFGDGWRWFLEGEDWYNPGFLKDVNNISDISTYEIFSCLRSETNTILKMVEQLKSKTNYDTQIDKAYENYTDWP
jgi:hypothetical protein